LPLRRGSQALACCWLPRWRKCPPFRVVKVLLDQRLEQTDAQPARRGRASAHGVPGGFKDALDWIVSSGELADKPVALLMASASGAEYARAALLPTLEVMGANIVFERSLVFSPR